MTNNNIQKAKELIGCFVTGDTTKAKSLLKDNYIQHNLAYATGAEAFCGSVAYLGSAPIKTTVNTIRAFEDGDKVYQVLAEGDMVLAVSEGTFGGKPTSYYDLWRIENDKIAEHWDVMETIAAKSDWQNDNGKF